MLCYTRYDAGGVSLSRVCCAELGMMLVGGTLQTVLCYTRCGVVCGTLQTVLCYTRYDAVGVALFRLCSAPLDMMLVCGVWYSPDCAVLH